VKRPTETQLEALAKMEASGRRLMRQPGGFWVLSGTYYPVLSDTYHRQMAKLEAQGLERNEWRTITLTVRALEKYGWVRRVNVYPESWRDERELTDEGRHALLAEVVS
jgi:hypothetical protein